MAAAAAAAGVSHCFPFIPTPILHVLHVWPMHVNIFCIFTVHYYHNRAIRFVYPVTSCQHLGSKNLEQCTSKQLVSKCNVGHNYYLPIHIIFERLEAVTVLNIWRVIRNDKSDTTSLGPVAL